VKVNVVLDGVKNLQGSTVTTGWDVHGLVEGRNGDRAAFMFNTVNRAMNLSLDPRGPFSYLEIIAVVEDFRQPENRITFTEGIEKPIVEFNGHSPATSRTLTTLEGRLTELLAPLPLKSVELAGRRLTESHIQCTTPMGTEPARSVVDKRCVHHRLRNLFLLGSGNFPTCPAPNPTLTICALSLYAAKGIAQ